MPRKANARRADGLYQRVVTIGKDENGKRIRKTVYGRTDKEAREKAEDLKLMLAKGLDFAARKDTFGQWADKWIKTKTCGTSQLRTYHSCLSHVLPFFEHTELPDIRPADLQLAVNEIQSSKGLAQKTMRMIINMLSQIFEFAMDNDVIERNPARKLQIPAAAPPPKVRDALTDEQIAWIVDTPHYTRIGALIMLLCGLRRGELCALRRSDVDLAGGWLHVRRSVDLRMGEEKEGGKTKTSVRDLMIPSALRQELTKHFAEQDKRKISPFDPLVFPQLHMEKVHTSSSWFRMWDDYMAALNLKYGYPDGDAPKINPKDIPIRIKPFTAHQLRHTYASLLYEANIKLLDMQNYLGHTKASTTLNVYTHLRNKSVAEQRKQLDDLVAKKITG